MTLGASALGQIALGGAGAGIAVSYVDIAAAITITSQIQSALTLNEPVFGEVNLSAAISIQFSLSSSLTAAPAMPDAGVGFTISDKAGGA